MAGLPSKSSFLRKATNWSRSRGWPSFRDSDQDFDPTAEMLVNDFDDEHTLEEEEAMESGESVGNELDDLQKEGEMPLDDLLELYGYGCKMPQAENEKQPSPNCQVAVEKQNVVEKEERPTKMVVDKSFAEPVENSTPSGGHLLRSVSQASESSGSESDDDYSPDDDWRKTIQVGSDFQAVVPEGLCKYDDAPAYENEDRLLWDPSQLNDKEVEEYLGQAQQLQSSSGVGIIPVGSHIRDDEQALYLLLQCGHNVEEALRRRRMQPSHAADTMSLWSEEECRSFENGLRTYGKDFHLIQQNKVRTRSVGELVQFYYFWKKTERHDVFASKTRLEKKKYALHPGTTDYMDRFLDEQENPSAHRDRSSSPSMQSLIFSEGKKVQLNRSSLSSPSSLKADNTPESSWELSSSEAANSLLAAKAHLDNRNFPIVAKDIADKVVVNGVDKMVPERTPDLQGGRWGGPKDGPSTCGIFANSHPPSSADANSAVVTVVDSPPISGK